MNPRRRWLAASVAVPALVSMDALRAQANAPVVIGWLSPNRRDASRASFIEGMSVLGWKLGAQYVLEERWADGQVDRLTGLAQELAAKKPAIIVTITSAAARAAAAAAPATPIVLASGDPMSTGLVQSLARPGGMITGLSNVGGDLNQKMVELLVESRPGLQRVGFLADPTCRARDANVANARRAAEHLRLQAVVIDMARPQAIVADARRVAKQLRFEAVMADMTGPQDIEPAFVRMAKAKVQAVVLLPSGWFNPHIPAIVASAMARRWPVIGGNSAIPVQGGLFSYAADGEALARRAAYHVDRTLKGAKPGDLPIEQSTTFNLVLNLKTAKALGITFPPSIRFRATEVIE